MESKSIKIFKVSKNMMKVGMLFCIFFALYQYGALFLEYRSETGNMTFVNFISYKDEETFNTLSGEGPSDRFLHKVDKYNQIVRTVWIALFFLCMVEIFAYLENREDHWINMLIKKMKKIKLDDDDDE